MKFKTPAALLSAGFLLSGALVAQDEPAKKPAPPAPAKPAPPAPAKPPAAKPAAPPVPLKPPAPKPPPKPKMDPAKLKTYTSYGFGFRNGRSFAGQTGRYGLTLDDIDREQFLKGLFDALELKDSALDQEEINAALMQLSEGIKEREAKLAETNKTAGEKFLAENKKREGVITTDSGLQYEILKEGDGQVYTPPPEGERPNKQFMTIYHGTLIDGTEFDTSGGKPSPMSMNVIPGFKEALSTMPVGSKWKLFIPANLAYKEGRRSAKLGPNSTLIFELELAEIKDLPAPPSRPAVGGRPGAPKAVSPPVRVPQRRPGTGARAVSPPVRIPTNPNPKGKPAPLPKPEPGPKPAPKPKPEPEPKPK